MKCNDIGTLFNGIFDLYALMCNIQARSKQPSFPPGASNLPNFLDIHFQVLCSPMTTKYFRVVCYYCYSLNITFHGQTLSFAMSEAVFVALLCLFPGSRFILTSDLQRQLDCDVHQLLNGILRQMLYTITVFSK